MMLTLLIERLLVNQIMPFPVMKLYLTTI
uniref:Uncharacterized protein n=1 Tax=Rhizophora mucronata TaxID=61149 RepID=A0A2P2MYZ8_RHIMU